MKFLTIFLNFLSLLSPAEYNLNKQNSIKKCSQYSVLENEIKCGENGYLIMYGRKYCIRFNSQEYIEKFDARGQVFLNCTTDCLLKSITKITREEEKRKPPDCDDLYHRAFQSHVKCYLECDFCNVCKTNKIALLNAYDIKDFMSRAAIKQIYQVIKECGPFKCF